MTTELITPDQVPTWVPGRLTVREPVEGWEGLSLRGYSYGPSDVVVPPPQDYVVVAYRRGTTAMRRRVDEDRWCTDTVGPGDVSLLTRAAESHWVWSRPIDAFHVYLNRDELACTCREMYECDVVDVELRDELKAVDPAIHQTAMAIAAEAARGGAGSKLLIDSLSSQLSVHILRAHADVVFRESTESDGLTFAQERTVRDYIHAHLSETISLQNLADAARLSRYHFARRFRQSTGTSPHEFVLRQRVEHAKTMLSRTSTPLLDVAVRCCGFADQSHLTRVFKKHVGTTPGRYRDRP